MSTECNLPEATIQRLIRAGSLLTGLGLYKCASACGNRITKAYFTYLIQLNYMQNPLTKSTQKELDEVWHDAIEYLDPLCGIKEWSEEAIEIYDIREAMHAGPNDSWTKIHTMTGMKSEIDQLTENIPFIEQDLTETIAKLQALRDKCASLGHLPRFDDSTLCRICGQPIPEE